MKSANLETYEKYKKLAEEGINQYQLIGALKNEGYSILEAMKVLRRIYSISLGDAKEAITKHPDWKSTVLESQGLHDDFEQAINNHPNTPNTQ
ncbi:hypothetical protein [Ereboglobus luteus]|uniref:Uncharacterized protein n=1 Tax=Ereboglobus luteus TaxID=1796921 RepID=A0A2U8E2E3_9BACT|nr:hypothetical protein [Ereboglobus luteus]AWI08946.1 hypothetical protein CKA38_06515 [Ereboglobus luteus]